MQENCFCIFSSIRSDEVNIYVCVSCMSLAMPWHSSRSWNMWNNTKIDMRYGQRRCKHIRLRNYTKKIWGGSLWGRYTYATPIISLLCWNKFSLIFSTFLFLLFFVLYPSLFSVGVSCTTHGRLFFCSYGEWRNVSKVLTFEDCVCYTSIK